ncbi:galactosylceramide sulfotransferase-like, partial [Penaeus japonicus]|uniref:galactosylceramide sulfotransferase-like n=1 Tax=Penaeus japonicus TaxID=27405 RepID=UPI001C70CD69
MSLEIPRKAILAVLVFLFFISLFLSKFLEVQQTSVMQGIPHPEHVRDLETATQPCIPQNSVYFLKIPKCASTTSLHIFVAYGVKHGLTFALPGWIGKVPISPKILSPDYHGSPDGRYNMVVSHTQFNKEGAEQVMKESAKYVASVREPASRFESNWYYSDYEKVSKPVIINYKYLYIFLNQG